MKLALEFAAVSYVSIGIGFVLSEFHYSGDWSDVVVAAIGVIVWPWLIRGV